MPKQSQRLEFNTFVKGLITEASPVNFPPNASRDEENFELHPDGSRSRRLGMDYEANSLMASIPYGSISGIAMSTFRWNNVQGNPNLNFLVQQVGNYLYFYDLSYTYFPDGYITYIQISSLSTSVTYSMASIEGRLVVASDNPNIAIIKYTAPNFFSVDLQPIKVRDLWGIEDYSSYEADPLFRDPYFYPSHVYNLYNQSWGVPRKKTDGTLYDPVKYYLEALGKFPSNSETVWGGLNFRAAASTTEQPSERMYPELYDSVRGSGVPAGKGYFIINLLDRGRGRLLAAWANQGRYPEIAYALVGMSGGQFTTSIPTDITSGGASLVEEFAGRVFFSGFRGDITGGDARSPILSNYVVFSQVVRNAYDIVKCYQEGDPTSRDGADLVDTDGGWIRISGARKIISLKNMGTKLVVLATNGVWVIDGGNNYGFSATNYKVSKISNYGCISPRSVINEGDRVYFASDSGIYVIGPNQMGDLTVESITLNSIQSLYDDIPLASKSAMFGIYDIDDKKLRWTYKTGSPFTSSSATYEIIFNLRLGAFSKFRIYKPTDNSCEIIGSLIDLNFNLRYITVSKISSTYYLRSATYSDQHFTDWYSTGIGADAKAYLLTGAITGGDSSIEKQVPYLVMNFNRTESGVDSNGVPLSQSSCLVRSQWEWADSIISKKWSPPFQAYRYKRPLFSNGTGDPYDNGFEVLSTKNKLRGRGKALSIYMETEPAKECYILGWNLTINANQLA